MNPSIRCRALIESFEGRRDRRYQDSAGLWTIGCGHLIRPGEVFQEPMSNDAIDVLFISDVAAAVNTVNSVCAHIALTQNQFDALTSFTFNTGPGVTNVRDGFVRLRSGNPSTMLRCLRDGDYVGASAEFPKWNRSGNTIVGGLVRRRAAERKLFDTPDGQ